MKKAILLAIALATMAGVGQAQRKTERRAERSSGKIMLISKMEQRKIFHWANGQRATPSGRQAGDADAIYARVFGDSAVVVKSRRKE